MKYFQSFCKAVGNYACYALCLVNVAEEYLGKKIDEVSALMDSIKNGFVTFNLADYDDADNFYVRQPHKVLEMLTGVKWEVLKESPLYELKNGEYSIEFYSIDGKTGHFVRMSSGFNSLQKSNSVKNGKVVSLRICRPA